MQESLEKRYVQIPEDDNLEEMEINFDELFGELEKLKKESSLSREIETNIKISEINSFLYDDFRKEFPPDKKGNEIYEEIDEKIKEKFQELLLIIAKKIEESGINMNLGEVAKQTFRLASDVNQNSKLFNYKSLKSLGGYYDPLRDKIFIDGKSSNPINTVYSLANGNIDNTIETGKHELTHREQYKSAKLDYLLYLAQNGIILSIYSGALSYHKYELAIPALAILIINQVREHKRLRDNAILRESHAYLSDQFKIGKLKPISDILNILKEKPYNYITPKNIDHIIMGSQEVKRLYALGFSDNEIGELVDNAKWDDKLIGYDKLEKKINEIRQTKKISEEDLDNLVMANDVKNEINRYKIKSIVRNEVFSYLNKLKQEEKQNLISNNGDLIKMDTGYE